MFISEITIRDLGEVKNKQQDLPKKFGKAGPCLLNRNCENAFLY